MAENTKIEWCDSTFNPWVGCTKVGPGCDHCYAEGWAKRSGSVQWGPGAERRRTTASNWRKPLQWNEQSFVECEACGWRGEKREAHWGGSQCPSCRGQESLKPARRRVFCASLADVFDNEVPVEWRADLFDLIAKTPNIDWLLVTKRIGNVGRMIPDCWSVMMPPNLWLGITVVNQYEADRDVPKLLQLKASVRFLSIEPLLGPVSFRWMPAWPENKANRALNPAGGTDHLDGLRRLDWVIVGGESGPKARPMHPQWARDIRDQCAAAGVPFLFKQWGEWLPGENETHAPTGRKVAHHQDGRWGATETNVNARNYVAWDESGCIHRGSLIDAPPMLRVVAWAERVGKKQAGRLLDGREHNGFPLPSARGDAK